MKVLNIVIYFHTCVLFSVLASKGGSRINQRGRPFLAHMSRKLIGELIVYGGIRHPSTFSNDISSEAVMLILFIFNI